MKPKQSIDEVLEEFANEQTDNGGTRERFCLTFWVSRETKQKYDAIQARKNRKFSPVVKRGIEVIIDRAFEPEAG